MDSAHVLVGCDTGLLKGVDVTKRSFVNLSTDPNAVINKARSVDGIFFEEESSSAVRLLLRNHDIVCLDLQNPAKHFNKLLVDAEEGKFVGGGTTSENTFSCLDNGTIHMNTGMQKSKVVATAGGDVRKMVQSDSNHNYFLTGGKQNQLKMWDLLKPKEPIFTAKNLPDDKLRLNVPVWINDMKFRPGQDDKIILTASAYHLIQVYDIRAQRKPVKTVSYGEDPLTSIDINPHKEFEFLIANRNGKVANFDLRGTKGIQLRAFTGVQGTVRQVAYHPSEAGYFSAISLDRFMRFYEDTQKSPKFEIYLKSTPTCFLFTDNPVKDWESTNSAEAVPEKVTKKRREEETVETEAIWNEMPEIDDDDDKPNGKKRKQ